METQRPEDVVIDCDPDHREGDEEEITATGSTQAPGPVLFAMRALRSELRAELRSGFEFMKKDLSEQMGTQSTEIVSKIRQYIGAEESDGGMRVTISKLKAASKPLPQLEFAVGKERASVPLLQWAFMVTVMSFTLSTPAARSWIGEVTYEKLAGSATIISGTSGLSMLLFSVKNCASKGRFLSSVGALWSFVLRRAMTSAILHAGKHVFNVNEDGDAENGERESVKPAWLAQFMEKKKVLATVNDSVDRLEGKDGSFSSTVEFEMSSRKRRKVCDDTDLRMEHRAVKEIRAMWMKVINYGRTEVRSHLYLSLMFIVEKIQSFHSVEEAVANGFEIVFEKGVGNEDEVFAVSATSGAVWNIPNSDASRAREVGDETEAAEDDKVRASNSELLEGLKKKFPSLTVSLRYQKHVRRPSNNADGISSTAGNNGPIFWPVVEVVHLHSVAVGVFMEIYKVKNASSVLGASRLSLKAVHVVAIALKGLLRKSLGEEPSSVERAALGCVTHEDVGKGDDRVSVMMEKVKKDGSKTCRLEQNRARKFEMAWDEYLAARKARDDEERNRNGSSRSHCELEGVEEDDEAWLT